MGVLVEQLVATSLREWLLMQLPAKVAEVNGLRAAVLRAPWAGPYVVPAGRTFGFTTATGAVFITAVLTSGTRTATQIAADINTAAGATVASEDSAGRLVLTSPLAPTTAAPSLVRLRGGLASDANSLFGWAMGGELELLTALVTPGGKGIADGWPLLNDLMPNAQSGGSPICVVLGDRESRPARPGPRGDEYLVTIDVSVLRIEPAQQVSRNREHIHSALRCVREVLMQDNGRLLGNVANGIQLVLEKSCRVAAKPFTFGDKKSPSPFFDAAVLLLEVRAFERPAAT